MIKVIWRKLPEQQREYPMIILVFMTAFFAGGIGDCFTNRQQYTLCPERFSWDFANPMKR